MGGDEVSLLMGLGLTEAEAKVYLRLLRQGSATAGELARVTGYSRTKVYEILEKLQREGLLESYPSRPIQFKALDPSVSIPMLVQHKRRELESAESLLCASLPGIWNSAPSRDAQIFINEGIDRSLAKFVELINRAQKRIYSLMTWVTEEECTAIGRALRRARRRGAEIRLAVYDNPDFREGAPDERLLELSEFSSEFYLLPADFHPLPLPPLKLLLVDDVEVNIVFGDYIETGFLKDAISVHYHNIPALSAVAKKIIPLYFETFFARFRRRESGYNRDA